MIYLILLLLFTSCGSNDPEEPIYSPPPEELITPDFSLKAEALVDEFIAACHTANNTACVARSAHLVRPISLTSASAVQAYCPSSTNPDGCATMGYQIGSTPYSLYVLIKSSIAYTPERAFELRALLWHELGHALLARPHTAQAKSNILSIMFPYYPSGLSRYSNGSIPTRCDSETRYNLSLTARSPIYCTQTALISTTCLKARESYLLSDTLWSETPPQCQKYTTKLIDWMSPLFIIGLSFVDFPGAQ